jgi:hypothetical protein
LSVSNENPAAVFLSYAAQERDAAAHVPDSFTEVQWMYLPGGETTPKFCARVKNF